MAVTELQRFLSKVDVGASCWKWTAAKDLRGYGRFWSAGRMVLAHRFAFVHLVGPIPSGLVLDHLCRNPSCVNPGHLEPVTQRENLRRSPGLIGQASAAKSHCPQGHPYDAENTYRPPGSNRRACRMCRQMVARRQSRIRKERRHGLH